MNLDKILDNGRTFDFLKGTKREYVKVAMREACRQALESAIKSFPSHEHPEIAKAIMNVMEEIE